MWVGRSQARRRVPWARSRSRTSPPAPPSAAPTTPTPAELLPSGVGVHPLLHVSCLMNTGCRGLPHVLLAGHINKQCLYSHVD